MLYLYKTGWSHRMLRSGDVVSESATKRPINIFRTAKQLKSSIISTYKAAIVKVQKMLNDTSCLVILIVFKPNNGAVQFVLLLSTSALIYIYILN